MGCLPCLKCYGGPLPAAYKCEGKRPVTYKGETSSYQVLRVYMTHVLYTHGQRALVHLNIPRVTNSKPHD